MSSYDRGKQLYFEIHDRKFGSSSLQSAPLPQRLGEKLLCSRGNAVRTSWGWSTGAAVTMVLKQCRTRLKAFRVSHGERWYDLSFNHACLRCISFTAPLNDLKETEWGRRRAPGLNLKTEYLSAVTQVSARGNFLWYPNLCGVWLHG